MATSLQQQHPAPSEFSGERIAVRNPRSGQVDHHFTAPSRAELEGMVGGLRRAQVAWREAPLQHRIDVLTKIAGLSFERAWSGRIRTEIEG